MGEEKNNGKMWLIILCIIVAFIGVVALISYIFSAKTIALEDSDWFEQETVKQNSEKVIGAVSVDDYSTLLTTYANEELATEVTMKTIRTAKDGINPDWGTMEQIDKEVYYAVEKRDLNYAIALIDVKYKNVTITYTLSFDTDMKLAGIYIK